jgi:uncharacterized protein
MHGQDESATTLVVMARYPTPGAVKTRLARRFGPGPACALYRAFLLDLQLRFAGGRRTLVWAFHPPDADFVGADARCMPQAGADLAARMHDCFRRLCTGGFARVLMIGADVPHVREPWLDEAEKRLDTADVVLGPSADGGYYLVGMRQPHDVFSGIAMGTGDVLAQTRRKAEALGLRVHLLPSTFDIDDAADLVRLRALLADGESGGRLLPHTAAVLAALSTEEAET